MSEGKYTKEELKIIQAINKSRTEERTILRQIADALSQGGEATKKIKKNHSDIADKLSAQARLLKEGTKEHRTYLNISERLSVLGRLQVEYSNKGFISGNSASVTIATGRVTAANVTAVTVRPASINCKISTIS